MEMISLPQRTVEPGRRVSISDDEIAGPASHPGPYRASTYKPFGRVSHEQTDLIPFPTSSRAHAGARCQGRSRAGAQADGHNPGPSTSRAGLSRGSISGFDTDTIRRAMNYDAELSSYQYIRNRQAARDMETDEVKYRGITRSDGSSHRASQPFQDCRTPFYNVPSNMNTGSAFASRQSRVASPASFPSHSFGGNAFGMDTNQNGLGFFNANQPGAAVATMKKKAHFDVEPSSDQESITTDSGRA